jgi:excisionase family DNA binding protein
MNKSCEVRPLASEPPRNPSPYLTAKEAAVYLRFASVDALYKGIKNEGIPVRRRGRTLLFHREELDRWLAGEERVRLLAEARRRSA